MNANEREQLEREFETQIPESDQILFSWYESQDYEGSAFVLLQRSDKLFEVNGGHCSCMGLEGQWEPTETSASAILLRFRKDAGLSLFDLESPSAECLELKSLLESLVADYE